MGAPRSICCACGCYMQLDALLKDTRRAALLQQQSFGAALLLLCAFIMKSNLNTSASASAAMVRCLPIARQYLTSSKVGKSHDVGNPYTSPRPYPIRSASRSSLGYGQHDSWVRD